MNEDFVPYELAVKLKEKGFDEPCYGYYYCNGGNDSFEVCGNGDRDFLNSKNLYRVAAPTISQVLKWLREEKKIHIAVDIMKAYPAANIIKWGYNVVLIDKYEVYHHDWNSDSYEQATLVGIEYVLDNLI